MEPAPPYANELERSRWERRGAKMPPSSPYRTVGEFEIAILRWIEFSGGRATNRMLREKFDDLSRKKDSLKSRIDGVRKYLKLNEKKMIPIPDCDPKDQTVRWYKITDDTHAMQMDMITKMVSGLSRLDSIRTNLEILRNKKLSDQERAQLEMLILPAIMAQADLLVGINEAKAIGMDVTQARLNVARPSDEALGIIPPRSIEERGSTLTRELAEARDRAIQSYRLMMNGSTDPEKSN